MIHRKRIRILVGASVALFVAIELAACGTGAPTPVSTAQVPGAAPVKAAEPDIEEVVITAPALRPGEAASSQAPAVDATVPPGSPRVAGETSSSHLRSKRRGG